MSQLILSNSTDPNVEVRSVPLYPGLPCAELLILGDKHGALYLMIIHVLSHYEDSKISGLFCITNT